MLRRVAASCVAAFLIVAWPVRSGVDNGTLADFKAVSAAPAMEALAIAMADGAALSAGASLAETADADDKTPAHDASVAIADDNSDVDAAVAAVDAAARAADAGLAMPQPAPKFALRESPPPASPAPHLSEPFGLNAVPVTTGNVVTKWAGVQANIRAGNLILARCHVDAASCPEAAKAFLAVVAKGSVLAGRMRIGVINRAVNLSIEPESDMAQWGVPDRWSPPLETFMTGHGDCEDYAIAKYVALTAAGVPAEDVKLIVVRNTAANEDHAVVAVRDGGEWLVLDNRWLAMVADVAMPNAVPRFVLDDSGVRKFE